MKSRFSGKPTKRVSKVGTPYWVQYYYDARGIRHSASGETKRKAQDNADAKLRNGNEGKATDGSRFAEFAEYFLLKSASGREGRRAMDFETARSYKHYITTYINPILGNKLLVKITTSDMRDLSDSLLKNTKTRTTAQRIFTITKVILRYAVTLEIINSVPGDTLRIASDWHRIESQRRARIPSETEMRAIEDAAWACYTSENKGTRRSYRRYYPLFLILRTTGMRISEALALKWGDFNSELTRVVVSRRVSIPAAGKEEEERISAPKTRNGIRMIPVSEPVKDVLLDWKTYGSKQKRPDDWLFAVAKGNPLNYSNVIGKFWQPLLKRANVTHYGIHSLRHYYASLLIKDGKYKELTNLLGHHSSNFTMDTYGHLIRDGGKVLDDIAKNVSAGLRSH